MPIFISLCRLNFLCVSVCELCTENDSRKEQKTRNIFFFPYLLINLFEDKKIFFWHFLWSVCAIFYGFKNAITIPSFFLYHRGYTSFRKRCFSAFYDMIIWWYFFRQILQENTCRSGHTLLLSARLSIFVSVNPSEVKKKLRELCPLWKYLLWVDTATFTLFLSHDQRLVFVVATILIIIIARALN